MNVAIDDNFRLYGSLLVRLHRLFERERGDSPEADALRDAMDAPWENLSDAQRSAASGLLADLNAIVFGTGPRSSAPEEAELARQLSCLLAQDWIGLLDAVRSVADVDPANAAFLRATACTALGLTDVAEVFWEVVNRNLRNHRLRNIA